MILPVILCGGSGTRLWPLSRKAFPKQLLSFNGSYSLLQETVRRLDELEMLPPLVICNEAYRFSVAEQLLQIGIDQPKIMLEPVPKNTAPAIALAALSVDASTTLLVLPADHEIKNLVHFHAAILAAKELVAMHHLVTFGIHPEKPETGYGYIKKAKALSVAGFQVAEFVEKPSLDKAKEYLESGEYCWNSGMFMMQAGDYLQELQQFSPGIMTVCESALAHAKRDLDFIRIDADIFKTCPSNSIDYAVMEKSKKVAMIPLKESGWSDLGSWNAVFNAQAKDQNNNALIGDVMISKVTNSYLHASHRLLVAIGVSDQIVIETQDALLIAHKDAAQEVKKIVNQLEEKNRSETDHHCRVNRPWGFYETIDIEANFQVKRIVVKPKASLSLQMHQHRSEHWVVVKGVAEVICGEERFTLHANQSTYIPVATKHRLTNPGDEELILVEVQTGSYLGEDDIVRFEDMYLRV